LFLKEASLQGCSTTTKKVLREIFKLFLKKRERISKIIANNY
jgi:hypothetical protein